MHSYPTHSPSRNQPAVASTGNRWTAILSIDPSTLPPRNREIRQAYCRFLQPPKQGAALPLWPQSIHAEYLTMMKLCRQLILT
jgi:hypothetical protein